MKRAAKKKLRTDAHLAALVSQECAKHILKRQRDSDAYFDDLDRIDAHVARYYDDDDDERFALQDIARTKYKMARDHGKEYVPVRLLVSEHMLEEHEDENDDDTGAGPFGGHLKIPARIFCVAVVLIFIIWAVAHHNR